MNDRIDICFFTIQSVLSINMKSPIKKLLVSTNQSSSGSLIYFAYSCFDSQRSKYAKIAIRNTMPDSKVADIDFSDFSIFIFKVKHVFMEEKDNPVEKLVIDEKEVDGIHIDDILSLENLPRTMFID